ncbi:PAS domain S-box protein [Candidatus Cyanaurora vandensis]|uniref:PAS domain S-box protein n=1 Tax=Candidatus Cyanaurora vandensis TaxID=2714958 RepID=UPI00257C4DF3|nr:PAS domain S-box protein [Candidatus Cyanaurora vandensis]
MFPALMTLKDLACTYHSLPETVSVQKLYSYFADIPLVCGVLIQTAGQTVALISRQRFLAQWVHFSPAQRQETVAYILLSSPRYRCFLSLDGDLDLRRGMDYTLARVDQDCYEPLVIVTASGESLLDLPTLSRAYASLMTRHTQIHTQLFTASHWETRAHQNRLDYVLDNIQEVVWLALVEDLDLYQLSAAAPRMFGRPLIHFYENPQLWLTIAHPEDQAALRTALAQVQQQGEHQWTHRILLPSGEVRWLANRAQRVIGTDPPCLQGVMTDITQLQQSGANLRAIFNNSLQGFLLLDRERKIQSLNPKAQACFKEILGQLVQAGEPLPEPLQLTVLHPYFQGALQGEPAQLEHVWTGLDGRNHWFELGFTPVVTMGGLVEGVCLSFFNITERKLAVDNLAHSEARFRSLVQHTSDYVSILQADGRRSFISPAVERILGYPMEVLLGEPAFDLIHPEDVLQVKAAFNQAMAKPGVDVTMQFRARHANGSWVYLESIGNNLLADPSVQEFMVNTRDITERKQVEARLQQKLVREQLVTAIALKIRASLNLQTILTTTVAEVHRILAVDRALIYRFTPTWAGEVLVESVGADWLSTLGHIIQDTCFYENQGGTYRQGRVFAVADLAQANLTPCHRVLLESFQVRANLVVPILQEGSGSQPVLWGLLIVHQCDRARTWQGHEVDLLQEIAVQLAVALQQSELLAQLQAELKERQRVEAELRRSLAKEKELGLLKSRFIAMASHEFRTPLTTILSASELLRCYGERMVAAERGQLFVDIESEVKTMNRLIEDVLTIGQAEASQTFTPRPLPLITFCHDLLEKIDTHTHSLVFNQPAEELHVLADGKLLRQVLTNLLSNSLKYSPPSSVITLTLAHQDQRIVFTVQDQGIGIPPEDLGRLFEPFHRGRNTDQIGGTGLGLAIAKQSVELHQGTITVDSTVGLGTIFTVILPVPPS